MELRPEACYRAVASRDRRFDGRFFTAVRSTGIYCRPICPARTPRRENCTFYSCAAAAEEAGFRPCLRCRPETSPGTPAWQGTAATVSRALRLIAEGALDHGSVDDLAGRLGVGERHLRRLFAEHVGASPLAVAQTRRVHFARRLLDDTRMPVARIADAAGFGSVRRFNAAMKKTFGRRPLELRRESGAPAADHAEPVLALHVPYRKPYEWRGLLEFLSQRATLGVEVVDGETYRRTIAVGGVAGVLEVRNVEDASSLLVKVPIGLADHLVRIVERVRRMFDCNADPREIGTHLRRDAVLKRAVRRRPGLRLPGAWDGFELGVRAILGQQVTVAGATTLSGRLVEAFGRTLPDGNGGPCRLFPQPSDLVNADVARIGMPAARGETIRRLARGVAEGTLALDGSADPEDVRQRLCVIPGIGDWTAQYVAMRALGEADAFPAGDLGVRRALANGSELPRTRDVEARAEAWRPWRAYATLHLWMED